MLNRRLIPKLQIKQFQAGKSPRMVLVTTVRFSGAIQIGDPISQARIYEAQAADELIFVDLDATPQGRGFSTEVIRRVAEEIFMPITVGGGVRSVDDFRTLLLNGADKVSVNTAAVADPSLINRASEAYGAQCVVLSIDYRKDPDGSHRVWTRGGTLRTDLDPLDWAIEGEKRGAGEIMLTSIDHDGAGEGLDLDVTRRVSDGVAVPVIASGGCGLARHFVDGFKIGKADAVAAGSYFCFRDQNPMQTRSHIRNAGIPIRTHI